jgi:TP901 family phage tail tape measure protein
MADDIQSNIKINVDTASAMDSIRLLQNQISAFHTQMSKMGAAQAADARNLQQNLVNSINSTGAFTANMTKVKTTAEQFTSSLERNKLSMGEYFRYAGGASKTFGRAFKAEFETINKVARERVKDLQSQYIKLGRDANGAMQAIRVRPLVLDMDNLGTRTQIAAQRQQLLNQLLKQGSTNLLNFGKNTQWAGRQLMVGFTIPLGIMGSAAMKSYKEIEEAGIRLRRVYGDFGTTNVETEKMVKDIQKLALEYTRYGVAVKDSMEMAADAAAMGKKGADLLAQVSSSARLAVLGGVDQQMALKTTTSLTDAFGVSTKQLAKDIDFLNAVENQTVLSIEDMTIAIPKAAPVIQQLGGDVKDLAFFLTAMKEGGINASESANALKSGLASLINPTNTASKMLQGFGINLREIVQGNKGDVKKTVIDFAQALDKLDPLNRAKAIEQLFGKFQFARLSTLFKNVIEQGSQASQVLNLASTSSLELSMLAQRELNKIEASPLFKFQKSIADFQAALAPVGEQFMKALTPIINFGTDVLNNFNNLGEGVKGFIVKFVAVAGVVGPVLLMSFGLIANAVANVIKGFALMKDIFNKTGKSSLSLGEQVNYMTQEQIQAAAIASSLDQVHSKLKQTFTSEAAAVDALTAAYQRSVAAQRAFAVPITPRGPVRKLASGGFVTGPGTGTSDSIPAMLSNGEAVIPAKSVSQNRDLVQSLINDSLPRFAKGGIIGGPSESLMQQVKGTSAVIAYGAHQPFTTAHQGIAQMGMSMAEQSGMPFFQFTSNQGKAKRSLLSDDLKSRMISEAIGRNPEFAKNPFELMAMLSKAGIKDVNILLGEDRMKSPVWDLAAKEYGINLSKTGIARPAGSPSGTMARAAAAAGNVGMFESLLASGVSKSTRGEIFKNLLAAATGKGKKFAFGGMVRGPGGPKDDLIPANLSNGEAVIDAETTRKNPRIIGALFAGKKIVLPGYAENNSESFGFEMPDRITQKNAKRIKEALDAAKAVSEDVLGGLTQSLNNITKFTQKNIDEVLYSPQFELLSSMTAAKQGRSTGSQGMVKAHGTLTREVSAQDVASFMDRGQNALLSQASKINAMNNLTFGMPASFNKGQLTGLEGASFVDNFYDDFMSQLAGQGLDTNSPEAKAFANNVARQMQKAGSEVIDDTKFAQIISTAISQEVDAVGKNVTQGVRKVFDEARKVSTMQYTIPGTPTARMNVPTSGRGKSANGLQTISPDVTPYRSIPLMVGAHQRADDFASTIIADRFRKEGIVSAEAFLGAQKAVLAKPQNDPAMVSRDGARRNSPHSQAPIDGKDDGVAYSQARTNAIAAEEAKAATKRSRRVTSEGPWITPQETQSQKVERTRGGRVRTEGESFLPGEQRTYDPNTVVLPLAATAKSASGMENAATSPSEMMTGRKMGFLERQGMKLKFDKDEQGRVGGKFRTKAFGASMGLGMASMFLPGQLAQVAQAGSAISGVGGMFEKAGPQLGDFLIKFGKPLSRLIPVLGASVLAFEVFDKAILPTLKKNADSYEAISESLNLTKEKIDGINRFFGTEGKVTGIAAATLGASGQNKEEASLSQQFRETEEFKANFQESASKLKELSDSEIARFARAQGAQLVGSGYDVEAAKAIVGAILLEAGKTDVKVDFASFDLGERTKGSIEKDVAASINVYKSNFQKVSLFDFEAKAKTKAAVSEVSALLNGLSGQFELGVITGEQFKTSFDSVARDLYRLEKSNPGQGLEFMNQSLQIMNPDLASASAYLTDFTSKLLIIRGLGLGLTFSTEIISALGNPETEKEQQANINDAIKKRETIVNSIEKQKNLLKTTANSSKDINNLESKINEKYDKRISQIEKIKKLNDQISKSQEGQLDLAQALNEGDIGAAAAAAINLQNMNVQNALDQQQTGLQDARKAELDPLKDRRDSLDGAVDGINEVINNLQDKLSSIKIELAVSSNTDKISASPSNFAVIDTSRGVNVGLVYGDVNSQIPVTDKKQPWNKYPYTEMNYPNAANRRMAYDRNNPGVKPDRNGLFPVGAKVPGYVSGGHITGPGSGTSDSIPAMLSNGEYVIRANAVKTIGVDTLNKLNQADRLGFAAGGMVRAYRKGGMVGCPCGTPGCPGCAKGYAMGGMVKKYKDGGIVESLFGNTQNWFNNLILSMFGSGGNPSAALNATAEDMTRTGIKQGQSFVKDYIFDPTNPVDIAMTAVPGLKPAKAVAKKAADALGFPLVLQTPRKGLKITPTRLADEAEGATPGAFRTINGAEYYVKRPETTVETTGELIGSTLWAKLGLGGPKLQMLSKTTLASKIIPDLIPSSPGYLRQYMEKAPNKVDAANTLAKATRKYIDEALPTNALLGNSDTHGMNILFNKKTKRFENIDLGITALTTEAPDSAAFLFADEVARRTRYLVDGMKSSGFNLRQTNDILKKNGLSEVSGNDFRYVSFLGVGASDLAKNAKYKKSLTPQINKISSMLGFDLKKPISDPVNVAAINAKSNPFIADMIKNNPELAKWMNLTSKTEDLESGMTGGLREMFWRLKNAQNDPIQKFAKGGLVGYKDGGEAKPPKKPRLTLEDIANNLSNPTIMGAAHGTDVIGGTDLANSYVDIFSGKGDFWDYFSGILAPFSFAGLGMSSKAGTIGTGISKAFSPIKKGARDVSTFVAAKKFGMQTKNLPPLINPGKGTDPALQAAKNAITKMRIGKNNKLEMTAANSDYGLSEMYDIESIHEVPADMLVGLQGSIRNTKARLYKDSQVGSVNGTIFDTDDGLRAQDIFVKLEEAYRGKGIAQRFTTQFMELLKNVGVNHIDIDASLTDGGYAWARANFKFATKPKDLIQRMEAIKPFINDKKFDKVLESLKAENIKDLPMPKEVLGLKTNWRKYFSEQEIKDYMLGKYKEMAGSSAALSLMPKVNFNTTSLGELIMRGSNWQGTKELGGSKITQTFQDVVRSVSTGAKGIGAMGTNAINSIKALPKNIAGKFQKPEELPLNPMLFAMQGAQLPYGFSKAPTKAELDAVVAFVQNSPLAQIQRGDDLASIVAKSTIPQGTSMFRVPTIRQTEELLSKKVGDIIDIGNRFTSVAGQSELQAIGMTAAGKLNTGNRELAVNTILKFVAGEDLPGIMNHKFHSPNYLKSAFGDKSVEYPFQSEGLLPPGLKGKIVGISQNGDQKILEVLLSKFANGGMVGKYANGGMVMPIPEPAPRQFANGGMVKAATGGMLINGKFLRGFAMGGMVQKFVDGGYAMGTDTVPAMLTPGEFVIKKSAVDRIGPSALNKINGYAEGGLVGGMSAVSGDSVYNSNKYEINVNVSSNSNPDQIANAVMTKIRQIDNKRVRGSAF